MLSNRADAYGLERAASAGVASSVVDHRAFATREAFDAAIQAELGRHAVELVCLAGFMRILTTPFVEHWRDRMLNIHPSLLPAFKGLHTHGRALAEGCTVAGCTVHLVRPELDSGPILVQGVAPVLPGDDAELLAARVLQLEHRCYPAALAMLAAGRIVVEAERARLTDERRGERLILHPDLLEPRRA